MRHPLLLAALLLSGFAAQAQQPTQLPSTPAAPPPASPTPGTAAPAPVPVADGYILGHRYDVKLYSGVGFTGRLTGITGSTLTFEAQGLGTLTAELSNIRQTTDLDAGAGQPGRPGRYDIGSGSRYYFGPSARNLRQGEGVVQNVLLFLTGINYGITSNISVGAYLSMVPGVGLSNQALLLTPKVGFAVGNNWHVGAGALIARISDFNGGLSGYGVGVLYGVATHGSADSNLSVGLGYGYAGDGVGSTPTLYLAGQHRVSRRISLVSENYFIAAHNPAVFGIYGIKVNWPRVSLGIASGYFSYTDNDTQQHYGDDYSASFFGYIYPVYLDVSFRFGKPYQAGRP